MKPIIIRGIPWTAVAMPIAGFSPLNPGNTPTIAGAGIHCEILAFHELEESEKNGMKKINCPNCNRLIPQTAGFCPYCGSKTAQEEKSPPPASTVSEKSANITYRTMALFTMYSFEKRVFAGMSVIIIANILNWLLMRPFGLSLVSVFIVITFLAKLYIVMGLSNRIWRIISILLIIALTLIYFLSDIRHAFVYYL